MKTFINILCVLALFCGGCKKFLDVNPKSTVSETDLFSSEIGFQQALIGVYSLAAERDLYGDKLSMGFVSALAQNYNPGAHGFVFLETTALNYQSSEVKTITTAIWLKSYTAIAGLNNIAAKIDDQKAIFTGNNYRLIKGESLGLRAYFHFELLRMFGASYALGAGKRAIPYRTQLNALSKVPETVEQVVDHVLTDLKDAEALLDQVDPILETDKNRRFKMNYLAIKALQARVYLFKGDKINAALAANKVVDSRKFSFVTNSQISVAANQRDRLFSNEQVFALRVRTLKDWADAYFKVSNQENMYLTRSLANFNTLYETANGGSTDYRNTYLLENDGTVKFPSKFWQTYVAPTGAAPTARLDQTVPLIRLSEMYYILAESAATPELGITALNMVRKNRGIAELAPAGATVQKLTDEITKEYQKEFYAEGQLFYYYKRLNFPRMQFKTTLLNADMYILPIPDSELEFNTGYN
uniref:RagB/SusD family nutrient uptake outer membrane protein n=1 Tax=Pedobacter schmidteae TaxID=2201271 RepID=UPI0013CE8753|nr:RagB/SusD family nutrient uptake outer membrane protein [Pedobacter schmidteae]